MKSGCTLLAISILVLSACVSHSESEMQVTSKVDIDRFMGDWYVIASIPTFFERNAYNPIERYSLNADGTIDTRFIFNDKSAGGPVRAMKAKGYVSEGNNAVWGMQFFWPFRADYRIAYLDDDYQTTIIGRNRRDYVWIMSRSPVLPEDQFDRLVDIAAELGYDMQRIVATSWQTQLVGAE